MRDGFSQATVDYDSVQALIEKAFTPEVATRHVVNYLRVEYGLSLLPSPLLDTLSYHLECAVCSGVVRFRKPTRYPHDAWWLTLGEGADVACFGPVCVGCYSPELVRDFLKEIRGRQTRLPQHTVRHHCAKLRARDGPHLHTLLERLEAPIIGIKV